MSGPSTYAQQSQLSLTIPHSPVRDKFQPARFQNNRFSEISQLSSTGSSGIEELSAEEYNGEDDVELSIDDLVSSKPDPLHTIEKPFRRQGP